MQEYSREAIVRAITDSKGQQVSTADIRKDYVAKLELGGALYVTGKRFTNPNPYGIGQNVTIVLGIPEDWIEDNFSRHPRLLQLVDGKPVKGKRLPRLVSLVPSRYLSTNEK